MSRLDGHLDVDLHGGGDLAVPQDLHGDAWMDFKRGKQGATCVACAVHRDR